MRAALVQALASLRSGETVPFSRFPEDWAEEMLSEGGVSRIARGSRQSLKVLSLRAFDIFLLSKGLKPGELQQTLEVLAAPESRAEQVRLLGDSKAVAVRSCPGFPVNVVTPLNVRLGGRKILLCPCPGSFVYVSDYASFRIPSDVIVVGVENMENFRLPERQESVFDQIGERFGGGGVPPVLLVSRYPQSRDLVTWLQGIPNPYVHFGDFDLAGVHIFLTEFYRYLGQRATFFVPQDIRERLEASGSRERYDTQFQRFGKMPVTDARLQPLVQLIHRVQKGYDQEGYIEDVLI